MSNHQRRRDEIRPTKERIEDELLALPGVNGVDINVKTTDGQPTGELVIVVYVDEKIAKSKVPKSQMIPSEIDGIPTDVQEEKIELQGAFQAVADIEPLIDATTYRPVKGGVSLGPCRSIFLAPPDVPTAGNYLTTGTLGAIVKDRTSGVKMALTNFHVAAVDTNWSVGDDMAQPSRVEGGSCPTDTVGELTRAVLSERVDGAVITFDSGVATSCSIQDIGKVKGRTAAVFGQAVRKRGRTTELTYGSVNSTDLSVTVPYPGGIGSRTLKHQIRVAPDTAQNARFSDRGDSGSVVVDGNNKVIGLLFAGTTSGSATYLNPIDDVLNELNVDLCVDTFTIITKPVLCDPIVTQKIVCLVTVIKQSCPILTKTTICNVLTTPLSCVVTKPAFCSPVVTKWCPPISLACGFPGGPGGIRRFDATSADGGDGDGEVDDAFWLGYYSALEAAADAESASADED